MMSDTLTAGVGKSISPRAAQGKTPAKVLTLPGPSYKRPSGPAAQRPSGPAAQRHDVRPARGRRA